MNFYNFDFMLFVNFVLCETVNSFVSYWLSP